MTIEPIIDIRQKVTSLGSTMTVVFDPIAEALN